MKRETALRYAREIARRLHEVNGILATPNCDFDAVRISRVWVFGSAVKGADRPNDLDVLIEMRCAGRRRRWTRGRRLDKRFTRSFGVPLMPCATEYTLKWLTKNMRGVSRHLADIEKIEIDVKRLIYPAWEIDDAAA